VLPSLLAEQPPAARIVNRTVMKSEWVDPDDLRPNQRTGRTIPGHRAFCPLRWCIRRHGERSSFTVEHVEAADRLRGLFDGARIGFAGLRDWRPVSALNYRPSTGPSATALRQLRCRTQFDRVWALFGTEAHAVLAAVVLKNLSVGRTAELLEMTKPLITQRLVEALDRLCLNFDIEAPRRAA
jgi:hypothetical protein